MLILAAQAFVLSLVAPHVRADAAGQLDGIACVPNPALAQAMIGGGAAPDLTVLTCTIPTNCGAPVTLPFFHDPAQGLYSHAAPFWWTLAMHAPPC